MVAEISQSKAARVQVPDDDAKISQPAEPNCENFVVAKLLEKQPDCENFAVRCRQTGRQLRKFRNSPPDPL